MRIGWIGLGKLGLPAAYGIASRGHAVVGYDPNPAIADYINNGGVPFEEEGLQELLDTQRVSLADVSYIVGWADIIFCAVQTPHDPKFEGDKPIPKERADFDYTYLKEAVKNLADQAKRQKKRTNLVVISTCLHGTYRREIAPLLNEYVNYTYNPWFIAMGTALEDFFNPEFVLLGGENNFLLDGFYSTIHDKPLLWTDITTAEAIKVSYNTFITMKTVLANAWGEMAHKLGFNIDDVYKAWSMATDRLISPKYLKAGMGDGGGCHPRDNIALSYIAKEIGMSHNLWEDLMAAREDHAKWLAQETLKYAGPKKRVTVLGRSFKPETNLETGSPAILVAHYLEKMGADIIHVEDLEVGESYWNTFLVATQNERYKHIIFPAGSTVIDPFRYLMPRREIKLIQIGKNGRTNTQPPTAPL